MHGEGRVGYMDTLERERERGGGRNEREMGGGGGEVGKVEFLNNGRVGTRSL